MDTATEKLLGELELAPQLALDDVIVALVMSAVLTFVIARLYMFTHAGYSYSKGFVHAIVLVGVTVALIMIIIGSDIARAFALVGAMSIVRFRTPIKDSRDLVFVFAAIAVGMACGVQFHIYAAVFTALVVALALAFHFLNFGELPNTGYVLKVQSPSAERQRIAEIFESMCRRSSVVSVDRLHAGPDGEMEDIIYEVELKRGIDYGRLVDALTGGASRVSVSVLVGESNVSV